MKLRDKEMWTYNVVMKENFLGKLANGIIHQRNI